VISIEAAGAVAGVKARARAARAAKRSDFLMGFSDSAADR
jgi:hypothetical protein